MSLLEDVTKSPSDSNTLPSSNSAGIMVKIKKEMNKYLCLELQCSEDRLQWWNYHNRHFLRLSIMARKCLSIPAMVPLKCNVPHTGQHVDRCTLKLDVYHLKSASLQLKSRSTLGLQQNFYKARLFNLKLYVIKPFIVVSTYHRGSTHVSRNSSTHLARSHLASCSLCRNHVTYCLFESTSCAKQENL